MRFLVFTPTGVLCLCRRCAIEQLPYDRVSSAEYHDYAWDLDQGRLIVLDCGAEQPCMGCKQSAPTPDTSVEYLLLHVYLLIKFLKAHRDLTAYGGTLVDEVMNLISKRFAAETEAIRAQIERLVQ